MTIGSIQDIIDCDNVDQGCNGGDPRSALDFIAGQGGMMTSSCYPYIGSQGNCNPNKCKVSPNLRVGSVVYVGGNETSIYNALLTQTLAVLVDASAWQFYSGGIFPASKCTGNIDHTAQLVGYSPKQGGYWIIKNNWGSSWGLNGFIYLQYAPNVCGINTEVTGVYYQ